MDMILWFPPPIKLTSSSSSSSINLQITSGVLSQMTIYACPMETSFQQTIYKYEKPSWWYIQLKSACLIDGNCLEAVFESFQGGGSSAGYRTNEALC
jgi:hypothetical protein